jgi:hypothetical protein
MPVHCYSSNSAHHHHAAPVAASGLLAVGRARLACVRAVEAAAQKVAAYPAPAQASHAAAEHINSWTRHHEPNFCSAASLLTTLMAGAPACRQAPPAAAAAAT